ncbi:MAG TPA: penicillin-binding transpeptidase domain-containing protein [Vitreimonas sp.]|nr:penicillin-binding transpeptidase domain-containing protein [Vitreimonas sp.]
MAKNHLITTSLSFRFTLIIAAVLSLFAALLLRLLDVQIVRGAAFLVRANNNRHFTDRLPADRGVILDRYGQALALNGREYIELDSDSTWHQQGQPLSREEALRVMASDSGKVAVESHRWYVYPEALSAVVGYVGAVNREELIANSFLHIQDQVGKLGLEKKYDQQLHGVSGSVVYEVNALGERQRAVKRVEAQAGQDLQTTLDPYLSDLAYQALGDQKGAVVIADATSGAVLALVSKPSFDANVMSIVPSTPNLKAERQTKIQAMFDDERQLFFNRVASGAYPPGSIFKMITALAGLESGQMDANTTVVDEGVLRVGEYEYRNWYFTQFGRTEGPISVVRALARSNDIFFYKAAEWAGPDNVAAMARRFGLGVSPGSGVFAEAAGLVPDTAWKESVIGERWYLGNTYHMGIGQGDLLLSPLQAAQMVQALANNGVLCAPYFVQGDVPKCRELSVQPEHLELILRGMLDACSPGGTAFPFFEHNGQVRSEGQTIDDAFAAKAVACKTGTAEFGGTDEKGYRKTHGWFAAILAPPISNSVANEVGETLSPSAEAESATESPVMGKSRQIKEPMSKVQWQQHVAKHGFPQRLVMIALVESDDQNKFKEGSRDAGPVVKKIWDGMR